MLILSAFVSKRLISVFSLTVIVNFFRTWSEGNSKKSRTFTALKPRKIFSILPILILNFLVSIFTCSALSLQQISNIFKTLSAGNSKKSRTFTALKSRTFTAI
eukprot:GHVP01019495.1.p1 GENE.GHVP01019495.1~~GHVP01019495.1.p1  ORF type:complete len:103 (-),score=6.59 GHVP01019495.1:224-532(-)